MRRANSLVAVYALAIGPIALATTAIPPTIEVNWQDTIRVTVLPEPFGPVSVDLKNSPNIDPTLFAIVSRQSIRLTINDLPAEGEIELEAITYSDPSLTSSGEVEYFEVLVLFGAPYKVRFEPCEHSENFTWEQDLAVFRINRMFDVSREIISFRQMGKCES